jgi:hypothetical protein
MVHAMARSLHTLDNMLNGAGSAGSGAAVGGGEPL